MSRIPSYDNMTSAWPVGVYTVSSTAASIAEDMQLFNAPCFVVIMEGYVVLPCLSFHHRTFSSQVLLSRNRVQREDNATSSAVKA